MAKAKAPKPPGLKELALLPADAFSDAKTTRHLCALCERGVSLGKWERRVPAGYTKRLLAVFDMAPKAEEVRLFLDLAKTAGYEVQDVAWVSAVRCSGPTPSMEQIRCCRPFVLRALDVLKPERVLALGSSASRSLANLGTATNVTKLRGRALEIRGRSDKFYVTYAPSSLLQGGIQYKERILEDLRRSGTKEEYPVDALLEPGSTDLMIAVDTEYAPDGSLLTLGIADTDVATSAEIATEDFKAIVTAIDASPAGASLVGHSLAGDIDYLVRLGVARRTWVDGRLTLDSLLLARMVDENRGKGGYELETLLLSSHDVEPWKYKTKAYDETNALSWPPDLRQERCRLDAWASAVVAKENYDKLCVDADAPVVLTHRIAMSLHRIELAGVYIDMPKFNALEDKLQAETLQYKDLLTRRALATGMKSFSPTNDADLRELLFKRLKLEVVQKTKGGKPSVNQTTLKQHIDREEVKLLLDFNKADKLLSTNVTGVRPLIHQVSSESGWLPVHINPLGARTGRRSSERPNMQNWTEPLRQMVVSRYPGGCILEFDYKSLEVFLLAFMAGDDKLFDYFATKGGYIAIARDMWKTEVVKGSREYRATKSVVLGTNYNMQTPLMAENLWFMGVRFSADYDKHEREVDRLRNAYLDMFPGLRPYMAKQKAYLLKHQCVKTLTGRVRHLPLSDGRHTPGFGRLVNQAINFPIQGLAADVTGSALIDCENVICQYVGITLLDYHKIVLDKRWNATRIPLIINEVHDNLLFDLPWDVHDDRTTCVAALLKDAMEKVVTLRTLYSNFTMPLRVDMKIGPHWGMTED